MIDADVTDSLYAVKIATTIQSTQLHKKRELTVRLTRNKTLSAHLQRDPGRDNAFRPRQLNLHTTHHTLVLLIEQAFLDRVHFDSTLGLFPRNIPQNLYMCCPACLRP
ncbi:hypothetical protein NLU13_8286 [Sarocladium strictum]|uniref:Uncharacterized protein n=1 Tax=Sarocladium strictum TaxID=5046 RepID=A0AA39L4U4_SARSR|nr:hypothetical protein NLU13_8286 [Sarocladium strictum]